MAAVMGQVFGGSATVAAQLVQDRENLYGIQKGIEGINTLFQGVQTPASTGLRNLAGVVSTSEILSCGVGVFTFAKYAGSPKKPEDVPVRLFKDTDGIVKQKETDIEKRNNKINKSAFAYDMEHRPQKAMASLGFLVVSITSFVKMLEAFAVPVFSTIERGIGMIPVIGKTLGSGIANHFYAIGGIALIAAHGALVFDSIRYLYLAGADGNKSVSKGVIQLVARVAALALDLLFVLEVSNPIIMGCAGIGMATLSIASCIYKWYRSSQKEQQQKQLLELAEQQAKERERLALEKTEFLESQAV